MRVVRSEGASRSHKKRNNFSQLKEIGLRLGNLYIFIHLGLGFCELRGLAVTQKKIFKILGGNKIKNQTLLATNEKLKFELFESKNQFIFFFISFSSSYL